MFEQHESILMQSVAKHENMLNSPVQISHTNKQTNEQAMILLYNQSHQNHITQKH